MPRHFAVSSAARARAAAKPESEIEKLTSWPLSCAAALTLSVVPARIAVTVFWPNVRDTYWYLSAAPELMTYAARRLDERREVRS